MFGNRIVTLVKAILEKERHERAKLSRTRGWSMPD